MKLSTPLLTTIAVGIGLGSMLTSCDPPSTSETDHTANERPSPHPEPVTVDTALIDTVAELSEEELWNNSCPACGKG